MFLFEGTVVILPEIQLPSILGSYRNVIKSVHKVLHFCERISVSDLDPHSKRLPGSGSAWIDVDPNPAEIRKAILNNFSSAKLPYILTFCNNYLCTRKYYGHVYNFFRRANPLRGGLSLELETSVGPVK